LRKRESGIVTDAQLAPDLEQFLNEYVHSHEELAVLLHLRRELEQSWTAGALANELKITEESALIALEALRGKGLIVPGAGVAFRYQPASAGLDASVAELERIHRERRVAIIESMNRHAFERIRHSVQHALNGGFLLPSPRKEKR
jgi:hypothetical protein